MNDDFCLIGNETHLLFYGRAISRFFGWGLVWGVGVKRWPYLQENYNESSTKSQQIKRCRFQIGYNLLERNELKRPKCSGFKAI